MQDGGRVYAELKGKSRLSDPLMGDEPYGKMHHLAFSRSFADGSFKVYVNGSLVDEGVHEEWKETSVEPGGVLIMGQEQVCPKGSLTLANPRAPLRAHARATLTSYPVLATGRPGSRLRRGFRADGCA